MNTFLPSRAFLILGVSLVLSIPVWGQTAAEADFDLSGQIDFTDFIAFAQSYGGTDAQYDLNGNGTDCG